LSAWGDDVGAIVVVSHDRNFCDRIEFTHVATVRDRKFVLEQRGSRDSDWIVGGLSSSPADAVLEITEVGSEATSSDGHNIDIDEKTRKKAYNAPKRIAKLEEIMQDLEGKIAVIDEAMLEKGSDVGALVELNEKRKKLAAKVSECLGEWEELESIVAQVQ